MELESGVFCGGLESFVGVRGDLWELGVVCGGYSMIQYKCEHFYRGINPVEFRGHKSSLFSFSLNKHFQ